MNWMRISMNFSWLEKLLSRRDSLVLIFGHHHHTATIQRRPIRPNRQKLMSRLY